MAIEETQRKQLQIVAIALATGPLLFLAVVVFLRSLPDGPFAGEPATTFLTPISGLVAIGAILLHFVLSARMRGDLGVIRGIAIARLALTEGAALLACVAYLLEGQMLALAAPVAMVGWMFAMQFPTRERIEDWKARRPG